MNKLLLFVAIFLSVACGDKSDDNPQCAVSTSVWTGSSGYVFDSENFACENNPINSAFELDMSMTILTVASPQYLKQKQHSRAG